MTKPIEQKKAKLHIITKCPDPPILHRREVFDPSSLKPEQRATVTLIQRFVVEDAKIISKKWGIIEFDGYWEFDMKVEDEKNDRRNNKKAII